LAESLVFNVVPADTDIQAQPPTGQQIDIGGLPRDQGRLSLRQHQDPGCELEAIGDAGQIAEHHERVVE